MTMHILTAFPTYESGPGWSNSLIRIIAIIDGEQREVCLQPDEQTPEMKHLFALCAAANVAMTRAVERAMRKDGPAKASILQQIGEE